MLEDPARDEYKTIRTEDTNTNDNDQEQEVLNCDLKDPICRKMHFGVNHNVRTNVSKCLIWW